MRPLPRLVQHPLQLAEACQLVQAEWNFFLRGGPELGSAASDRASPSWLPSSQWGQIVQLAGAVGPLEGIADSMCLPEESIDWQEWAASSQPHLQSLPPVWEHTCTSFHRLLLLKVCACRMSARPALIAVMWVSASKDGHAMVSCTARPLATQGVVCAFCSEAQQPYIHQYLGASHSYFKTGML